MRVNQQQNNRSDIAKLLKEKVSFLLILSVYIAVTSALHTGCPIKKITGISCMGCGMSRAVISALRFDFAKAFSFHPLFILVIVGIPFFIFWQKIPRRLRLTILWLIVIIFLIVYIIRMVYFRNDVIQFAPEKGYIGQMFMYILNQIKL